MKKYFLFILAIFVFSSCIVDKDNLENEESCVIKDNTKNGGIGTLQGQILFWEGDHMPGPEITGTKTPVIREVYIYEVVTKEDMGEPYTSIFSEVPSELIAKTSSDENGMYSIDIPTGHYSVFVSEQDGYYANSYSGSSHCAEVQSVEISEDEVTELNINITYQAYF